MLAPRNNTTYTRRSTPEPTILPTSAIRLGGVDAAGALRCGGVGNYDRETLATVSDVRRHREGAPSRRRRPRDGSARRVVSGLFFFPRGGSAQVARALGRALPQAGWEVTQAAGSLGGPGEQTHARSFFPDLDLVAVDYSPGNDGVSVPALV